MIRNVLKKWLVRAGSGAPGVGLAVERDEQNGTIVK